MFAPRSTQTPLYVRLPDVPVIGRNSFDIIYRTLNDNTLFILDFSRQLKRDYRLMLVTRFPEGFSRKSDFSGFFYFSCNNLTVCILEYERYVSSEHFGLPSVGKLVLKAKSYILIIHSYNLHSNYIYDDRNIDNTEIKNRPRTYFFNV